MLQALAVMAVVNFSGQWTLDTARSTGLPAGMEQAVAIEQKGDTLEVTTTLISDSNDRVVRDTFQLGAPESDFAPQLPGVTARIARRSARWTDDRSFDAADHIEGEGLNGPATIDIARHWNLSDDGATLTIEQAVTNAGFTTRSRRVLTKGAPPAAPPATARMFPIDLTVPVAPTPFQANGKTNLVYELHVTSFRTGDVEWQRLDVLGDDGRELASYDGAQLDSLVARAGTPAAKNVRLLPTGARDVAFLWIALDGKAPARIHHRALFGIAASGNQSRRIVEGGDAAVRAAAIVLGPPVRGGDWIARWNGPASFHRRGLMVVDGGAHIAQRFAIDWNCIAADRREWHGDGKQNDQYSVYGREVIAVADAVVARVMDAIPENVPGALNPSVTVGIDTATGNSVSLRLPDGTYATYAHLQPRSIRVKEGQRVRRGDVLGLVGNSGNAVGPHLHFHVSTGPALQGEGVPYVFDSFQLVGREQGPPKDDGTFNGTSIPAEPHRNEMPAEHMLVRFG